MKWYHGLNKNDGWNYYPYLEKFRQVFYVLKDKDIGSIRYIMATFRTVIIFILKEVHGFYFIMINEDFILNWYTVGSESTVLNVLFVFNTHLFTKIISK